MYEEELQKLTTELRDAEEERTQLEQSWREKYMPDIEELIQFGQRRKHEWALHWGESSADMLLSVLYMAADERAQMHMLDAEIKRLKRSVREAREMVRFARGER